MTGQQVTYAIHRFTVQPGATVDFNKDAGFLTCLDASESFKVRFDDGSLNDFEAGLTYRPVSGFKRIAIYNPNASAITVRLGFGRGQIADARVTISTGTELAVRPSRPDQFVTGAAVSAASGAATLLLAADALRREAVIVSPVGAGVVYIGGDPAGAAGEGLPLLGGQSVTLETGAAIYARNDTGAAVALAAASLRWSA